MGEAGRQDRKTHEFHYIEEETEAQRREEWAIVEQPLSRSLWVPWSGTGVWKGDS